MVEDIAKKVYNDTWIANVFKLLNKGANYEDI